MVISLKNDKEVWTSDLTELTSLVFQHFTGILQSEDRLSQEQIAAQLDNLQIPTLTPTMISSLNTPIQPSEIKDAVFSLPKDSAPGPDGYHASFFQKNWRLVSTDVIAMVNHI